MPRVLTIYFDGLCQPKNPGGIATYGYVVYRGKKRIREDRGLATEPWSNGATNNVAEYTAIIRALEWLAEEGHTEEPVVVRGDSQLAVRQLNGEYKVKSPNVAPLYARVRELFFLFPSLKFEWIPREKNKEADNLTNVAYVEYQASHPRGSKKVGE
ncbi:MAG: ribonuclease HI [Planctomycetota bacterium]|jgi:ribonuclease HI